MAIVLPRIEACGLGLAGIWFSQGSSGGAYPCGRKIRLNLQGLTWNSAYTSYVVIHLDFCGEVYKMRAAKESPYGPFDPWAIEECASHSYITRTSTFDFYIDALQARIDGAWSSSEVLTIKASSYASPNPTASRTVSWQALFYPYASSDTPAPPSALNRTQYWNDSQLCDGSPADWGTLTIDEDGTLTLANL